MTCTGFHGQGSSGWTLSAPRKSARYAIRHATSGKAATNDSGRTVATAITTASSTAMLRLSVR
jgi:hypothetical protein